LCDMTPVRLLCVHSRSAIAYYRTYGTYSPYGTSKYLGSDETEAW